MTDRLTIAGHLKSDRVVSPQNSKRGTGSRSVWIDMQVQMVDVARKPKIKVFPENKEPEIAWILISPRSFAGKPVVRLPNTAGNFERPRLFLRKSPIG